MKRLILAAVLLTAFHVWAQKPKSTGERDALMAVQNATTADDRLKAIDNVLTKYADSEFKPVLLTMALQIAEQKNDYVQITNYSDRILEGDPKNALAQATMAFQTARRIRENDLDKEEQLAKADKYADQAIANAPTLAKPQSNITDADWDVRKKEIASQAHEAKGMVATIRKKKDVAIQEFKAGVDGTPNPDPATIVRLGQAYLDAGQYDDAVASFDRASAAPNVLPQVKTVAEQKKAEALKKKAAGAPAPAPK
jgi:tetratricopeptide (TPR) repeat protein